MVVVVVLRIVLVCTVIALCTISLLARSIVASSSLSAKGSIRTPQLHKYFYLIGIVFISIWAATWQNQQYECAPSVDSDQPGHPPSLIRVFAVRIKKAWVFSYPLSAREDSDQTGRMPRLILVFAGRILTLLVLSCRGSFVITRTMHSRRLNSVVSFGQSL